MIWRLLVSVLAPLILGYLLFSEFQTKLAEPYGGYPGWLIGTFGWGMVALLIVGGVLLSLVPWSEKSHAKDDPGYDEFLTVEAYEPDPETGAVRVQKGAQR